MRITIDCDTRAHALATFRRILQVPLFGPFRLSEFPDRSGVPDVASSDTMTVACQTPVGDTFNLAQDRTQVVIETTNHKAEVVLRMLTPAMRDLTTVTNTYIAA